MAHIGVRAEPFPEKLRVVFGKPRPAHEAHDAEEPEIDPTLGPVHRAGRAEQHDAEKDDPQRGADDEFPHEAGRNVGKDVMIQLEQPIVVSR